jgi:hypothetical protein
MKGLIQCRLYAIPDLFSHYSRSSPRDTMSHWRPRFLFLAFECMRRCVSVHGDTGSILSATPARPFSERIHLRPTVKSAIPGGWLTDFLFHFHLPLPAAHLSRHFPSARGPPPSHLVRPETYPPSLSRRKLNVKSSDTGPYTNSAPS